MRLRRWRETSSPSIAAGHEHRRAGQVQGRVGAREPGERLVMAVLSVFLFMKKV